MRPFKPPPPSRLRPPSIASQSPTATATATAAPPHSDSPSTPTSSSVSPERSTTDSSSSSGRAKTNRIISILVFNNCDILDLTGPYSCYHSTKQQTLGEHRITIQLLAVHSLEQTIQSDDPLKIFAFGGLKLIADCIFADITATDLLVIPGGSGVKSLLNHNELLAWLHHIVPNAELVHTISGGSLLLAAAGLLEARRTYCTHHTMVDQMRELQPNVIVNPDKSIRYTQQRNVVTSGGSSAGIDSTLYVVHQLYGEATFKAVADSMAYASSHDAASTAFNARFQSRIGNPAPDNR